MSVIGDELFRLRNQNFSQNGPVPGALAVGARRRAPAAEAPFSVRSLRNSLYLQET